MTRLLCLMLALFLLIPIISCFASEEILTDTFYSDRDESVLRTLDFKYDSHGLTYLRITMHDTLETVFECNNLPPNCWLDTYHDEDYILMSYTYDIPGDDEEDIWNETWFMTFEYIDDMWYLVAISNGQDWTADVNKGIFTFEDYYLNDPAWYWSVEGEDRLMEFDFQAMRELVERYDEQFPDRPSLRDDW